MKRFFLFVYMVLGLLALGAFGAGPALAYFDILSPSTAFSIFIVALLVAVPMIPIGVVIVSRGGSSAAATIGILASLVPAAFLVYAIATYWKYPLINDISTNSAFPPQLTRPSDMPEDQAIDLQYPKANRALIEEHYPDLQSLGLEISGDHAFEIVQSFVQVTEGWASGSTTLTEKESILQAHITSPIFHFKDDIAIRVTHVSEGRCVVDVRSRSRFGKGDLGANAAHIRALLHALQP